MSYVGNTEGRPSVDCGLCPSSQSDKEDFSLSRFTSLNHGHWTEFTAGIEPVNLFFTNLLTRPSQKARDHKSAHFLEDLWTQRVQVSSCLSRGECGKGHVPERKAPFREKGFSHFFLSTGLSWKAGNMMLRPKQEKQKAPEEKQRPGRAELRFGTVLQRVARRGQLPVLCPGRQRGAFNS